MSVTVQQILGLLQTLAPSELACSWDNVGLLVDVSVPVSHVLTTLDITAAVVQEAVENDCQLIVSHHPVIFDPLKHISAGMCRRCSSKTTSRPSACTPIWMQPPAASMIRWRIFWVCSGRAAAISPRIAAVSALWNPLRCSSWPASARTRCHSGVRYVDCGRPITCLAEVSGAAAATCRKLLMRARIALSPARPPTTSLCWLNRKALAWWSPVIGAPNTASPDVLAAHIASNFPALTVRHAAADRDPYSYLL